MANLQGAASSSQFYYSGRGPIDSKSIVATKADLTNRETWLSGTASIAYNGMIVAVWHDPDSANNGIYYFHDPAIDSVTSPLVALRKEHDVTVESNWHKISDKVDLSSIETLISNLQSNLDTLGSTVTELVSDVDDMKDNIEVLNNKKAILSYENRDAFPEVGESNTIYIDLAEGLSYIYVGLEGQPYMPISAKYEAPTEIYGGNANSFI